MGGGDSCQIILMGRPGSGHRAQAARLARVRRVPVISPGKLLRRAIVAGSDLGQRIVALTGAGQPLSDELLTGLVNARLAEEDCRSGFVLRDYPRAVSQAEALDEILTAHKRALKLVLDLQISADALVERAAGWRHCPRDGRRFHTESAPPNTPDLCDECGTELLWLERDREGAVRERAAAFNVEMEPMLAHYRTRGMVASIDATGSPDQVTAWIEAALDEAIDL